VESIDGKNNLLTDGKTTAAQLDNTFGGVKCSCSTSDPSASDFETKGYVDGSWWCVMSNNGYAERLYIAYTLKTEEGHHVCGAWRLLGDDEWPIAVHKDQIGQAFYSWIGSIQDFTQGAG